MVSIVCAAIAVGWVALAICSVRNGLEAAIHGVVFAILAVAFK